jgi:pyrroline-5-carboxylate reductase
MTERRVCILGAGNIGRALIGGLLRAGTRPEHVSAVEPAAEARTALVRDFGIQASEDASAVAGAGIVVLAVKPQDARGVLAPLAAPLAAARPLLISVAAGVRIAALRAVSPGVPVLRAMPNRPALLGAGVTGLYAPEDVDAASRQAAEKVMQSVGETVWVQSEDALDVVTALSGSGPAYFFLLAELMAEAATQLGLDAATARRLATVTLYGSGLMVAGGDADLAQLRQAVTSKGGTTEAALAAFAGADFRGIVARALAAAARRSRELGDPAAGHS